MPLTSGDQFAGFIIAEFLGSSATSARYRSIDSHSQATVHLEILNTTGSRDPVRRREFHRTNEILKRLRVSGAPRIVAFGSTEGQQWIATEFMTGLDAESLLLRRFPSGMTYQGVCLIADHVAQTLDEASRHGVTHGDVTAANVWISEPFSKAYRITLCGFGVGPASNAPASGAYAAPEILAGAPVTNRTDQFALAATAFHLLTARTPFGDSGRKVTAAGKVIFDVRALNDASSTVDGLERVFARAFAFDPAQRFRSCREFTDALIAPERLKLAPKTRVRQPQLQSVPRAATPPSPVNPSPEKTAGRSKLPLAVAAVVVVAAVTTAALVFWPGSGEADPPPRADAAPSAAPPSAAAATESACGKLDATLAGLSLREKLAQTLMVGVTGFDDAQAVVNDHQVGGIFIGSWTDLNMLESGQLRELQSANRPVPLAVSIDEEGGRVQRLRSLIGSQDSPRSLVAEGNTPQQVRDIAFQRGVAMRDYGITIDFAPVVDITDAPDNTVIGDRSFGNDAATVIEFAGAYAQGLREAGLLPVLKHFPGHGRASGDSHINGVTTPPIEDLLQTDTVPYQTLSTQQPVAVMLGHMEVPGLTGTDPASLSAPAYDLLRQGGYGGPSFDGPIFTDDLSSMGAINQRYGVPDAVLRALQAGADTALWISTDEVPAVLDRLELAVDSGDLAATRLDDAVRHMAVTKDPGLSCQR